MALPGRLRHLLEAFHRYRDASESPHESAGSKASLKQRLLIELRRHTGTEINRMLAFASNHCVAMSQSRERCGNNRQPGSPHCWVHSTIRDRDQARAVAQATEEATLMAVPRPALPIVECDRVPESADHLIEPSVEQQTRAFLMWNYATMGRRPSRRYEGYRR